MNIDLSNRPSSPNSLPIVRPKRIGCLFMGEEISRSERIRKVLSLVGALFLGGILVVATFGKVLDPILLVQEIRNEGLDIIFSANTVTLIALALEMGLGMALLLGMRSLWVLIPSSLLVAFFMFLTGKNYWLVVTGQRDESFDCGCFGVFMERSTTEAFWQDLFLLVPALLLAFLDRKALFAPLSRWKTVVSVLCALAVIFVTVFMVGLPVELEDVGDQGEQVSENEFARTGQFLVHLDGVPDDEAQVFESALTLEFILISPKLEEAVVIDVKTSSFGTVPRNAVPEGDDSITLNRSAELAPQGSFSVGSDGLSFEFEGHEIQLKTP
jgi:hypothetical protein